MKFRFTAAIAVISLCIASQAAHAETTTVIVPTSAGGGLDGVARIVTSALQTKSSDSYVVDNRGGANGLIGAKAAAAARPDGKTWLITDSAVLTVNPSLFPKDPNFDPEKDLALVAPIGYQTSVLVVNPKVFPGGLKEFIAKAKAEDVPYASGGMGSAGHLTMASFGHMAGLKLVHVPYKGGGPAMADLVGGQIGVAFVALSVAMPHIKSGALNPLAVASRNRVTQLPQVPTVNESGFKGFDVETAFFVFLPQKSTTETIQQVRIKIESVINDPAVQERIRAAGMEPAIKEDASASLKWVQKERPKWSALVQQKVISAQ